MVWLAYRMRYAPRSFVRVLASKKIGITSDDAVELFLWLIPLAIVFARLLYVIPRADEYFGNNGLEGWDKFVNIIAIWKGGITIIGGLVGGLFGALFFTLRHKKKPTSSMSWTLSSCLCL